MRILRRWEIRKADFFKAMDDVRDAVVEASIEQIRAAMLDPNHDLRQVFARVARGTVKDFVDQMAEDARAAAEAAAPCVEGLTSHDFSEAEGLAAECLRGCGRRLREVLGAHHVDFVRVFTPGNMKRAIEAGAGDFGRATSLLIDSVERPAPAPRSTADQMAAADRAQADLRAVLDRQTPRPAGRGWLIDDEEGPQ